MGPDAFLNTAIFSLLAEVYHLGRFMMAQTPEEAELYAGTDVTELIATVSQGNAVVRLETPGEPISYWVVQNGTVYLTPDRPKDVKEEEIKTVKLSPPPESVLLPRLKAACREAQEMNAETYEQLRIGDILDGASAYYATSNQAELAGLDFDQVRVMTHLLDIPYSQDYLTNPQSALDWAELCIDKLHHEYNRCATCGDAIRKALAVLYFCKFAPLPANVLFTLGSPSFSFKEDDTVDKSFKKIPIFNLKFYLLYPTLNREDMLKAAVQTAEDLKSEGDRIRAVAQTTTSFERFHQTLYTGFIYYRCAQGIYGLLRTILESDQAGQSSSAVDLEEIKREWVLCEEMRAHIITSLGRTVSYHSQIISFTILQQFGEWLNSLLVMPPDLAEQHIRDFYGRLIYPKFIRDLALGWLLLMNDKTFDKGAGEFLRVAKMMEANMRDYACIGEPNYLSPLYKTLANALRGKGRVEEADMYDEKSTPEYIQQRLAQEFQ